MNIFRMAGDMCHVWSKIVLLRRLILKKNAHGISPRTQVLYLVVFVMRYLDLFTTYYSLYNSLMKIFYIASTACILGAIQYEPLRSTCDTARDTFPHWRLLVLPSFIFATIISIIKNDGKVDELLWTFSLVLEPLAILPQLFLVFRYREIESVTWIYEYIIFMGAYRALYILNWIYRAHTEPHYRHHFLVYICGVLQTLVYADFLLFYVKRVSLIRWMALREVDAEYLDAEEENDGGQFELLLDDELLLEEGEEAAPTTKSEPTAGQRSSPTKSVGEVKDGFITILK